MNCAQSVVSAFKEKFDLGTDCKRTIDLEVELKRMFTIVLYILAGGFLLISFIKDKKKTKIALRKRGNPLKIYFPSFFPF